MNLRKLLEIVLMYTDCLIYLTRTNDFYMKGTAAQILFNMDCDNYETDHIDTKDGKIRIYVSENK